MSIAIQISDADDIESYDGLISFVTNHLQLDAETALQLPTLIRMAEYRLNREVLMPERETSTTLSTVAGERSVALPVGFRQMRSVYLDGEYVLSPVTLNVAYQFETTEQPSVYAIAEQALFFGGIPDAVYAVNITYLEALSRLSPTNQTNWLLSTNADAYVYATLIQAEAFLGHDERIPLLDAALSQAISELNRSGNRYRNASPMRLRNPVGV